MDIDVTCPKCTATVTLRQEDLRNDSACCVSCGAKFKCSPEDLRVLDALDDLRRLGR